MFENAKWIAKSKSENIIPAPFFRKTFFVDSKIKKATLNACGLGLAEYYINGKKVTDNVLITPYTKYDSTVIYSTFDVTEYLQDGKNAVGIILGNGCYLVTFSRWDVFKPAWLHHLKMILQLDIEYEDGRCIQICSDKTFKSTEGPIIYNETKRGEIYDARLELAGWSEAEYNDEEWDGTFICRSPGGILRKQQHQPIRVTKEYPAVKISDTVYDIGQNISGWVKVKGTAKAGHKITIRYAECLKDGKPDYEKLNTIIGAETHEDSYIFSGKEEEEWAPRFAYHGFRYFEILNAPENLVVTGQCVHTDLETIGNFECSDELLNKLHHMSVMSTLTNCHGLPTDCPQREQNGWTGDALLSSQQSLMNFNFKPVYDKWFQDIRDCQRPSGQICAINPTAGWGYNWGSGPAWDSFHIIVPYYIYQNTNDTSTIEQNWESMEKYMEFMNSMTDNYIQAYGLGDWFPPDNSPETPLEITDTAYYYVDCKIMAECARLIGRDGSKYDECATKIREAFRNEFIIDGLMRVKTQTAVACAIYQGMLEADEIPANAKLLNDLLVENNYNTTCGILGMKYIFSALSENGYVESIYKMVSNPKCPSYAYWVNNGMTTLCEKWDMSDSMNHHMYSEVDMWFYKHLAGIKINGDELVIEPVFLEHLEYVKAHHKKIEVYWDKKEVVIKSDRNFKLVMNNKEENFSAGEYRISR